MNITLLIICSSAVTFFWRAGGALLSGKVHANSPAFKAAACMTYGIIGGLILKLIVYPQGAAADTELLARLLAVAGTLAIYFASRSVATAAWGGCLLLFWLIQ